MALTHVRETICGHTTLSALRLAWCHRLSRVGPGWYWRESWALSPRVFGKRRPGALQMGPWSASFSLCSVLSLKSIEMWMRISCFFLVGFSSHFTQKANSYFDCVGVCAHTFFSPSVKRSKAIFLWNKDKETWFNICSWWGKILTVFKASEEEIIKILF